MISKADQTSFQPDDLRIDYALIAVSVVAGLAALAYLILT